MLENSKSKVVHINDMNDRIGTVEIIDIREPYEYQNGSLDTAANIPMGTLLENPSKYLQQEQTYYIMCQSGGRSSRATGILSKMGYDVVDVAGGMGSYVGTKRTK